MTALAAGFLHLCFFRRGVPVYLFGVNEGGVWIDEAVRVLHGERIYRDFFEFVPPGIVLFNAAVLAVFGERIEPLVHSVVLMGALLAALVHSLAARVAGPGWRLLPPAVFVVLSYASYSVGNHKWPALLFGLAALQVLAAGRGGRLVHASAGSLLGLGVLFTTDFGLGMAAGVALSLWISRVDRLAGWSFAAGLVGTLTIALAWAAAHAGMADVLQQCLVFPLKHYIPKNPLTIDLLHHQGPRALAQLVVCAVALMAAVAGLRGDGPPDARLMALASAGLLLATAHRPVTQLHLVVRCTPLLGLVAWALEHGNAAGRWRWPARASALALVIGIGWAGANLVLRRQWLEPLILEQRRAGRVWAFASMPEMDWLEQQTRPAQLVFLLPAKGGFFFLSGTRNASAVPYLLAGQDPAWLRERVIADLVAKRPLVGVWSHQLEQPALYREVERLYAAEEILPNGSVLMRLRESAGGRPGSVPARPAPLTLWQREWTMAASRTVP